MPLEFLSERNIINLLLNRMETVIINFKKKISFKQNKNLTKMENDCLKLLDSRSLFPGITNV